MIKKIGWFVLSAVLAGLLTLGMFYLYGNFAQTRISFNWFAGNVIFIQLLFVIREWQKNKASALGIIGGIGLLFFLMQFYAARCNVPHNSRAPQLVIDPGHEENLLNPDEGLCSQGEVFNNNLELTTAGPASLDASIALNLANEFIRRQKDLKRFLITEPAVGGMNGVYQVRYKLFTKSEKREAVVRVNVEKKTCERMK